MARFRRRLQEGCASAYLLINFLNPYLPKFVLFLMKLSNIGHSKWALSRHAIQISHNLFLNILILLLPVHIDNLMILYHDLLLISPLILRSFDRQSRKVIPRVVNES